jgi:hypothetical protein
VIFLQQSFVIDVVIRILSPICFFRIFLPLDQILHPFPFLAVLAAHDFFNFLSCFVLVATDIITMLILLTGRSKLRWKSHMVGGESIRFDE